MKEKNSGNRFTLFIKNNFLLFFSVYFIAMFLEITTIDRNFEHLQIITSALKIVAYLMFATRLVLIIPTYVSKIKDLRSRSNKYFVLLLIMILMLSLSLICTLIYTGNKKYIMILLVVIASYGTDLYRITKRMEKLQIICTSVLVLLSVLGIVYNYAIYREDGLIRNSFGFGYPSSLAQMIMCISILHLFNSKFCTRKIDLLVIQVLNIGAYAITNSKTELLIIEIILVATLIYNTKSLKKHCIKLGKFILSLFSKIFWILPITALILVITYTTNPVSQCVDKALSNRIRYPYSVMQEYGFSIFGKEIEFVGNGIKDRQKYPNRPSNFVDNEYLQGLFTNGIMFFITEIAILSMYLYVLRKQKDYKIMFISMIFLIFALLNPKLKELIYCPILFMIVKTLMDGNIKQEIQEKF